MNLTFKDGLGAVVKTVDQSYDLFNRWVRSTVDPDGAGVATATDRFFAYDGYQIVLEFDGTAASDLVARYVWSNQTDQLLSVEQVTSLGSAGSVIFALTDHLGTTRDLVTYNTGTNIASISSHRFFDSFGNLVSETNSSVTILIGFTGRPFDTASGKQWNLNRWYVAEMGVWMSEDPIGFQAGDTNVRRYVQNHSLNYSDPLGLWKIERKSNKSTAIALAEVGDTIESLARLIGLDAKSVNEWGTVTDSFGETKTISPSDLNSKISSDDFCTVEIPNTVLMYWDGDLGAAGRRAVQWNRDHDYLKERGFFVKEQINPFKDPKKSWSSGDFVNYIKKSTASKELHGLFVWGHGLPTSFGGADGTVIDYTKVSKALAYKLGLVILNVCYGGYSSGDTGLGREVDTGGRDLASDNAKFFGLKRILFPVGVFNPLEFDWATITDFNHVEEVLKPGDQGTTK